MEKLCISLGGSVVSESGGLNLEYVRGFVDAVSGSGKQFIIVTGGGHTSRQYVDALRKAYVNEFYLDMLGIKATEMNAMFVKSMFDAKREGIADLCSSIPELKSSLNRYRVAVTHGQIPGITTDAVAVLACEAVGCRAMINVSDVPYVYDRPPGVKGARKLTSMSHDRLMGLANRYDMRSARSNFIFDLAACKFAKRSGIELRFVDDDVGNLRRAIAGRGYRGTTVR